MPTPVVYERLLQFPLFKGMGHADLTQIVAHTKFSFEKYDKDKRVIKAGEACHRLYFLTHGTLQVTTVSETGDYRLREVVNAPYTLQQECLFGMPQRFRSTFTALTPVNFIVLDKKEVTTLFNDFFVFRLNALSIISSALQMERMAVWNDNPASLRQHIVDFMKRRCEIPTGEKTFHILMSQLALYVNDSRLDVSRELNRMQQEGLVSLSRGQIRVPDIGRLV